MNHFQFRRKGTSTVAQRKADLCNIVIALRNAGHDDAYITYPVYGAHIRTSADITSVQAAVTTANLTGKLTVLN